MIAILLEVILYLNGSVPGSGFNPALASPPVCKPMGWKRAMAYASESMIGCGYDLFGVFQP
jgi:hypothetical protein